MTLRDEIAEIIQVTDVPWVAADEIIDLFRDALLSDKAISAAVDAREPFPHIMRDDLKRHMTETLTAALDAITQETT